jgi:hypothetical protein
VRWLRPALQNPSLQPQPRAAEQQTLIDSELPEDLALSLATVPTARLQTWPATLPEQIKLVAGVLSRSAAPQDLDGIAAHFKGRGRWRERLPTILDTLEAIGRVRVQGDNWSAAR